MKQSLPPNNNAMTSMYTISARNALRPTACRDEQDPLIHRATTLLAKTPEKYVFPNESKT